MTKSDLQGYAKMFMAMVGKRITDEEIQVFLDALGPELKKRIRDVLNTVTVSPKGR